MVFHGNPDARRFDNSVRGDMQMRAEARRQAEVILKDARVGDWMEAAWGWAFKTYDQPEGHPYGNEVAIHIFFD